MGKRLLPFFLLLVISAQSQVEPDDSTLFSEAIRLNIRKYTQKSQDAYAYRDFERAEFLYDSLVQNVVIGSLLDNFNVRKLSGRRIELYRFKKPIFLITYSSWCVPAQGEIPALNAIAKEYSKQIDFVVLFWDTRINAKKSAKKYSGKINIIYVDEKENTNNYIVGKMKHSLGLPTSFLIDKDKRIQSVRRGATQFYEQNIQDSPEAIYNYFKEGAKLLTQVGKMDKSSLSNEDGNKRK